MSLQPNTLYSGDCLDWMRRWDDASVDLIYLDPPFNSKTDYNVLYSATGAGDAQFRAFSDTWTWDSDAADRLDRYGSAIGLRAHDAIMGLHRMLGDSGLMAYLTYMAERLEECRRLLKPTGSIYLHCDPTASHYLKAVMDGVFGPRNFRNEIIWHYRRWTGKADRFQRLHDVLLFYSGGSREITFRPLYDPYTPKSLKRKQNYHTRIKGDDVYVTSIDKRGVRAGDVRALPVLNSQAKERLGYPTQKPLKLLERIIKASTNEGDLVLDPFCGCGTAMDAASRLGRRWAGIDISSFAIDLIRDKRMKDRTIPVKGIPYDLRSAIKLAADKPFEFESWAVTRLPGFAPNTKQVADGGVDGRATIAHKPDDHPSRLALAQVKGGKFSLSALRDFIGVTDRNRAALGYFVTLEPVHSRAAKRAVANTGRIRVAGHPYRRSQLWPISDYFDERLPAMPVMADPYSGKPLDQGSLF